MGCSGQSKAEGPRMWSNFQALTQHICFFFLPSSSQLHWVHPGGLSDLSSHCCSHEGTMTTTAAEMPAAALDHPCCCSSACRGLVPPDSLWASLVYELQGSGQTDNGFLDLSGCQKNPHGNQAKLLVRPVEDGVVFVRHHR